jgi:hypothetical protein
MKLLAFAIAIVAMGFSVTGLVRPDAFFTVEYGDALREWWATHGPGFVRWGSILLSPWALLLPNATAPRRP